MFELLYWPGLTWSYITRMNTEPFFDPFRFDPGYRDFLDQMSPSLTAGLLHERWLF
jgi:hypothetical protein